MHDFWVFGYGSLMWQPDFDHVEARPAVVHGWHRAMCILSTRYRGRPGAPGLVLGLDRGGSCRGIAFRVPPERAEAVKALLHEREMITGVYDPRLLPARLDTGATVPAYAFVARRDHEQYVRLGLDEQARLIADASGARGRCRVYLENTVRHLRELNLPDATLEKLLRLVEAP